MDTETNSSPPKNKTMDSIQDKLASMRKLLDHLHSEVRNKVEIEKDVRVKMHDLASTGETCQKQLEKSQCMLEKRIRKNVEQRRILDEKTAKMRETEEMLDKQILRNIGRREVWDDGAKAEKTHELLEDGIRRNMERRIVQERQLDDAILRRAERQAIHEENVEIGLTLSELETDLLRKREKRKAEEKELERKILLKRLMRKETRIGALHRSPPRPHQLLDDMNWRILDRLRANPGDYYYPRAARDILEFDVLRNAETRKQMRIALQRKVAREMETTELVTKLRHQEALRELNARLALRRIF